MSTSALFCTQIRTYAYFMLHTCHEQFDGRLEDHHHTLSTTITLLSQLTSGSQEYTHEYK